MIDMNKVLGIIGSSKNVYDLLVNSYIRPSHPYKLRGTVNRSAPLYTTELYTRILEEGLVPSVDDYSRTFSEKYFPRKDKDSARIQANIAYKSLLTEIHFYFLLRESGQFDEVKMSFDHDILVKSDVLITKNGVSIGLQLFSGDETYVNTKIVTIGRFNAGTTLAYPLHALPLKGRCIYQDAGGFPLSLYGQEDINEVMSLFRYEQDEPDQRLRPELDVDRFVMMTPPEQVLTPVATSETTIASHSIVFGGKVNASELDEIRKSGVIVHHIPVDVPGITPFQIVDGCKTSLKGKEDYLKKYGHRSKGFNYNQYIVEHASHTEHIAINAGAGSGKTTTLIARIMYLLDMGVIDGLDQIAMITFTNEAANNMEEALAERLVERLKLTGDPKYMKHINDLRRMDILTIPSFAKKILTSFGQHLGLGGGFRVSQMTMERRRMVKRTFDEVLQEKSIANPFEGMWYYEVREFLETVWDKFEQKGVVSEDFSGVSMNPDESDFTKSVIDVLMKADEELYQLKLENDVIGISDLTRFMKKIYESDAPLEELSDRYRYLFVDEFQDTDVSQIQSIVSIIAATDIRLVAVGDVKQGIYRFRGADSSAFTVLDETMSLKKLGRCVTYRLDENFRSSRLLVEQMERHFSVWRESPSQLLPPGEDRMVSNKETRLTGNTMFLKSEDIDVEEIKLRLNEITRGDKEKGGKVLAILVRRNREARDIGEMIRKDGDIKNLEVRMDGTLFESYAARDLMILINSWIYPEQRDALYSLSTTAFSGRSYYPVFKRRLIQRDIYISSPSTELSIHESWTESLERLKYSPLLSVLDSFIDKSNYKTHLREAGLSVADTLQYELNLHKIMMLIHETFADGPLDLLTLHEWLEMQVATNRDSDEAELDDNSFDGNLVRVLTVHRAKGLQFDTVMIPFTKNPIVRSGDGDIKDTIVYVSPSGKIEFAWKYKRYVDDRVVLDYETLGYEKLKSEEDLEQIREETRLLYVAMTRAEERLFIYGIDDKNQWGSRPNTWRDLLKMARRTRHAVQDNHL
ncbi:UvrD-helicase domain-containing protein (plasmid) [Exiguobacterium acetylicum]|uniref:UvrD-helicase domain-containing protein n=1 Tax=Exiguobacterium acetylicum TaxID=41170 RepID=UPI003977CCEB